MQHPPSTSNKQVIVRPWLRCLALFVVFGSHCLAAAPTGRDQTPILFIGNSFTYANDLPGMVGALFAAQRQRTLIDQVTPGGASLAQHAKNPAVAQKIASRKWRFVVLQDQSMMPAIAPAETVANSKRLSDQASKVGATPIFYLTWGYPLDGGKGMDTAMQLKLNQGYGAAAKASKGLLAPVGPAWAAAMAKDPSIRLYQKNDYHPSPEGTYLAACVIYAVMSKRSPVGLPSAIRAPVNGKPRLLVNLPAARARFYQHIAWHTVQNFTDKPR